MKDLKGKYMMVMVAMCGVIASSIGMIINVSGVFISPVAADFGVGKGDVSLTLTIANMLFAIAGMTTTKFLTKMSFKKMMVVFTALFAGTTVLMAMSPNLFIMYVICALRGFSAGAIGMVFSTLVLNNWFIKGNALVTSVAFGFSGIAGAILSPLTTAVINASGWRTAYLILAAITVVLNLPAILLPIDAEPEKVGMKPLGETAAAGTQAQQQNTRISFLTLLPVILFAAGVAFSTALPQHFPGMAENAGIAAAGSIMLSVSMIVNTAGKFIVGVMISKMGWVKSLSIYCILVIAGIALGVLGGSSVILMLSAALIGFCYSLTTVGAANITRNVFGAGNYGRVYPKVSLSITLVSAIAAAVVGYMYDFTGSYTPVLLLTMVLVAVSLAMVFVLKDKKAD